MCEVGLERGCVGRPVPDEPVHPQHLDEHRTAHAQPATSYVQHHHLRCGRQEGASTTHQRLSRPSASNASSSSLSESAAAPGLSPPLPTLPLRSLPMTSPNAFAVSR